MTGKVLSRADLEALVERQWDGNDILATDAHLRLLVAKASTKTIARSLLLTEEALRIALAAVPVLTVGGTPSPLLGEGDRI